MNRRELVGHIAEELGRVFPEGNEDLDGDDLESAEAVVETVFEDARKVIDDANAEEETETES